MSQRQIRARLVSYAIECAAAILLVLVILYTQALAQ